MGFTTELRIGISRNAGFSSISAWRLIREWRSHALWYCARDPSPGSRRVQDDVCLLSSLRHYWSSGFARGSLRL
jgi:hypothetical protein